SAASSDAAGVRALLIRRDDQIRQVLEELEGEPRAVEDEPLEPLLLDDEKLDVFRGDGGRGARPLAKEPDLAQRLALADPVHDSLDAVEAPANLDLARVDHVGLVVRLGALLEDDVTLLEPPSLDVAEREVLVELEADRRQRRLRLDRQARVGPAAEAAFEDAHGLEPALPEDLGHPRALLLLRARAVRDDHLLGLEVDRRALSLLGLEPVRPRQ